MTLDADVAVVGAGPAGWAAAAACADAGLTAILVAPEPAVVWPNTYGCWVDELEPLYLSSMAAVSWPSVRVVGQQARAVARAYAVLDNARLHGHLADRLAQGGGTTVAGSAVGVQHFTWGSRLLLAEHGPVDVRLVVDGSGTPPRLVKGMSPPMAVQDAYGIVGRFDVAPIPPGTCTLMDWTSPTGRAEDEAVPTFLYAMDLGDDRYLVEETSLAARAPVGRDGLRRRLEHRLERLGVTATEVLAEEDVMIPMGVTAPPVQPVAATGAAAGLVHPATGYSVAAALRCAPLLAAALRQGVDRGDGPAALSATAWQAVWPRARRRARRIELFGLERLLGMASPEVRSFFDAFFALPDDRWVSYLSGSASERDLARTMSVLFRASPWSVRRRLLRG